MSYDDYGDDREFRVDNDLEFSDPELEGEDMEGMHVVEEEESDDPEDRFS